MVGGHNSDMPRRPAYLLGKGDSWMATTIERSEDHYEAKGTSYGEAHICDARSCLVLECVYGESLLLTFSEAVCRCGADHTVLVREKGASDGGTHA
jgi:hypothetical protein